MRTWTLARTVAATLVGVTMLGVGFVPLFDGPGYEHSFASGLLVPAAAAVVTAIEAFDGPSRARAASPLALVARGVATGALFAAIALATSFVHVLRVGPCDPLSGLATFALGAGWGAVLGGATGAVSALVAAHVLPTTSRRRRAAIALAALAPVASISVAIALFYFTPAVFAFDPYVGFFSGTLYDEVVDAWVPLLTYRTGTAATVATLVVAANGLTRDAEGRLRPDRPRVLAAAALCAIPSIVLAALGGELGHRTTSSRLRAALGGSRSGARCEVVYPRSTPDPDAALLVRDCEEALAAVEARLGAKGPPRITAYFFRDAAQKRSLIGAADTYVAKPWRREIYLQLAAYPHPVLGHELAHVVAGSFGRGPFAVAGRLSGLWPNPGLIEGVAVAGSPDRDELTAAQWAHAMRELSLLPPLRRIFGAGFLAQNSSVAYTVAGAFVGYLFDTGRGGAVRAWYAGRSFESAFGGPFAAVEATWRRSLDAAPLPPEALLVAKGRFDRPAIWGRRCPHVVERLRADAWKCRAEGDLDGADARLARLLRLDERDPSARIDRASLAAQRGDTARFEALLRSVVDDRRVAASWRARAREGLGDGALRAGDLAGAKRAYADARALVLDEDWARTLDVKEYAAGDSRRATLFGRYLAPPPDGRDHSTPALFALARSVDRSAASDDPDPALARYLVARRLLDAKAYPDADDLLASTPAPSLEAISARVDREAARMRLLVACMARPSERASRVDEALARYRLAPPPQEGRREAVERLARRCRM